MFMMHIPELSFTFSFSVKYYCVEIILFSRRRQRIASFKTFGICPTQNGDLFGFALFFVFFFAQRWGCRRVRSARKREIAQQGGLRTRRRRGRKRWGRRFAVQGLADGTMEARRAWTFNRRVLVVVFLPDTRGDHTLEYASTCFGIRHGKLCRSQRGIFGVDHWKAKKE